MATSREKIERFELTWRKELSGCPEWKDTSRSRKWLKEQMNRYIRRQNKKIDEDDVGGKRGRKPQKGWEF